MPKLSVVIPVYREEACIRRNFEIVKAVLDARRDDFDYEIILVNDGSPDDSLAELESIHGEYPATTGIVSFTRNFGQVAAILAGLQACSGDCAAVISADLQDPPELIPVMFRKWCEGWKTVAGVRGARQEPLAIRVPSRLFYSLMRRLALPSIPATGFDFFLIDRAVMERLLARPESNGFLQGEILYVSGPVHEIVYTRRQREAGESNWSMAKKIKYFVDGFVGYSCVPIRLITVAGIGLFFLGIIASVGLVIQRVWFGTRMIGWTSIVILMLLLHGTEMLMIGVLGEYLWRTLDQARGRPLFIIDYRKLPSAVPVEATSALKPRVIGSDAQPLR